eukprot:Rhum_TRINITY_DN14020_c1_g5::Rhum_TRINITY_DN14020_c1_g5_i1::g.67586::m.67586
MHVSVSHGSSEVALKVPEDVAWTYRDVLLAACSRFDLVPGEIALRPPRADLDAPLPESCDAERFELVRADCDDGSDDSIEAFYAWAAAAAAAGRQAESPKGVQALAAAVRRGGSCGGGGLEVHGLRAADVRPLCAALRSGLCPAGLSLSFERGGVADVSAQRLAGAVASGQCPVGLTLNLERNRLTAAAADGLLRAATAGSAADLTLLLGWNGLGDAGAESLAASLAEGVRSGDLTVCLAGNKVGKAGAEALFEALQGLATESAEKSGDGPVVSVCVVENEGCGGHAGLRRHPVVRRGELWRMRRRKSNREIVKALEQRKGATKEDGCSCVCL